VNYTRTSNQKASSFFLRKWSFKIRLKKYKTHQTYGGLPAFYPPQGKKLKRTTEMDCLSGVALLSTWVIAY